jgi:hypothetical protein
MGPVFFAQEASMITGYVFLTGISSINKIRYGHPVLPRVSGGPFFLAVLLALSLLVSGCGPDDDSDEVAEEIPWILPDIKDDLIDDLRSIKERFGAPGVTETFNTLHQFIRAGGLASRPDVVNLGSYIDLDSLEVEAYGEGDYTGAFAAVNDEVTLPSGEDTGRLRLIVVGINSFRSGKGVDYQYNITVNDGVDHVVFQFHNIPVQRRMNKIFYTPSASPIPYYSNDGGYAASEMRKYLTPVADFPESGKFLAGLLAAGVPKTVLWAPARYVSKKENAPREIRDTLWLPTEGELYEQRWFSDYVGEIESNQARLEYYTDDDKRIKYYNDPESGDWDALEHWSASAYSGNWEFYHVDSDGKARISGDVNLGVAPAFCVW